MIVVCTTCQQSLEEGVSIHVSWVIDTINRVLADVTVVSLLRVGGTSSSVFHVLLTNCIVMLSLLAAVDRMTSPARLTKTFAQHYDGILDLLSGCVLNEVNRMIGCQESIHLLSEQSLSWSCDVHSHDEELCRDD